MNTNIETQAAHYLRTGERDQLFPGWAGSDVLDRIRRGDAHLREALSSELRQRMQGRTAPCVPTACCVSPAYFHENDPFADFIVHEAAHVFHNCKRKTVGPAIHPVARVLARELADR
ncbi:hypothetical protein ACMHYB_20790 [Sorangium sp. So ce1128]